MIPSLKDLFLGANDEQPRKWETAESVKSAFEPRAVIAHATANEVLHGFSFNSECGLESGNRIIAGYQCSRLGLEPRKRQRILLARIDHYGGFSTREVTEGF